MNKLSAFLTLWAGLLIIHNIIIWIYGGENSTIIQLKALIPLSLFEALVVWTIIVLTVYFLRKKKK